MDWTTISQILLAIATLVAGGGWWVNRRAARRLAEAQAETAAVEAPTAAIAALKSAMDELSETNRELNAIHDKDTAAIAEKNESNTALREENAALKMMICKHAACPFKEPPMGRGALWWEQHKADEVLTDTESIGMIGKRYGYVVKRLPVKDNNKDNGDNQ